MQQDFLWKKVYPPWENFLKIMIEVEIIDEREGEVFINISNSCRFWKNDIWFYELWRALRAKFMI